MSVTVVPLQISSLVVTPLRVGVAPSPSDHGTLAGLGDDDHPHYLNDARGDARYAVLSHGHAIDDVAALQTVLDGKAPTSHTHVATQIAPYEPTANYNFNIPIVDPSALTGQTQPGNPIFGFSGNSGIWNNAAGGSGHNPYRDHTAFLGYNFKNGGVQDDPAMPSFGIAWESAFTQTGGTVLAHEWYLRAIKVNGQEFRPFGGYIPHDGVGINFAFCCDDVYFQRDDGATQAMKLNWSTGNMYVFQGHRFTFETNNVAVAQQRNAAGNAHLKLPYIDNANRLRIEQKVLATAAAGTAGVAACEFAVQGAPVSGELGISISYAAATNATIEVLRTWANTNWEAKTSLYNGSTAASSVAAAEILTNAVGGTALTKYGKNGGQTWAAGKDANDNYRIATDSNLLSANIALVIDKTTRQAAFHAPPKLPSYTVAGLPSAATAGAGALAYVTNAAGGPTLACSNGTDWRIVAALGAVVS